MNSKPPVIREVDRQGNRKRKQCPGAATQPNPVRNTEPNIEDLSNFVTSYKKMKTNNQLLRDKIADLEKQLEREVNEKKKSRMAHNRSLCNLQKENDIAATKLRRMQTRESSMAVERQALENEVELLRAEKSEARQEVCELQSSLDLDLDAKTKALDDLDKKHQQLRRRLSEVIVENRKLKEQTEKAKEEVKKGIEKMKFLKRNVRGLVDGS